MIERLLGAILLLFAPPQDHGHVVETPPLSPAEQQKRFRLPPGFEIQLVAAEPDVVKPMNLAFDDRGRLLATQSYEYPHAARPGAPARDTLRILEDFGPDGRARKVTVFADGLNIPIGVASVPGAVIAHSIPKVWRMSDRDGDGSAERREPLYGDHGFQDTHGMLNAFTPWVDGWIYACHGFANRTELKASDGRGITMHSGNTWRMKADGSALENYSFGQVNPFGLSFDPLGNVFTADCHSKPAYQVLRGAWYPTFDGRNDGLGHGPALMNHIHGSTGIGGIVYYAATQFPPDYRDTIFIGNPITHRINHDRLQATGSTFKAVEQPDFLKCDDPWFRPVDLKLAPDGTLYVADFYTCIIGHYEVPLDHPKREKTYGRIWRIVHTGTAPRPMPDLDKASTAELVALLRDDTLTVRVKAAEQLVHRKAADAVLAAEDHPYARAHGLWILERLGRLDEPRVRRLAADADRLVRTHLLKALGERGAWAFEADLVRGMLADPDPWVRRAAAEALGLHPEAANVRPLLALWASTLVGDAQLVHQARVALRNQLLAPGVYESLGDADPDRIADVSLGAATPESARWLLSHLRTKPFAPAQLRHVARYGSPEVLAGILEHARGIEKLGPRERVACLQALQQAIQERGGRLPETFVELARNAARTVLEGKDRGLTLEALKLARELRLGTLFDEVASLAGDRARTSDLRGASLDALAAMDPGRAVPLIAGVARDVADRADVRLRAVAALAGVNSEDARVALVEILRSAPQQASSGIAAALAGSREGAEALLAAVAEGKAPRRVLLDRAVDGRLKASRPANLEARVRSLTADLPPEDDRIRKLIDERRAGFGKAKPDASRGGEVFRKNCAGCHVVAGQGKKVGPELDGIAHRGLDRILEDVLDPNRAVDQAFRATLIRTTDGRVISGLILREEGEVLVVQEAADKETRVARKEIEQRQLSQLSPMPSNVTDPMPEADLYDLLAFLLAQRPK